MDAITDVFQSMQIDSVVSRGRWLPSPFLLTLAGEASAGNYLTGPFAYNLR
jgi:hypothetical protein